MTIQPISVSAAALYITSDDLEQRGLSGSELTLEQTMDLARTAFEQEGLTLTGSMEIEAFPNLGGVLVFVHLTPPKCRWISFDCLDHLLSALPSMVPIPQEAKLYYYTGCYWLSLPPDAAQLETRLTEFGTVRCLTTLSEAALTEHGDFIASGPAFDTLRKCFSV